MGSFHILLQTAGCLDADFELGNYISTYSGVIRYTRSQDGKEFSVGRLLAYRLHVDQAANDGVSLFEVCDAESQDMHDLYVALFDIESDDLRDDLRQQFDAIDSDLLILDHVVLNPRWRRLKIGLMVVRRLIDLIGGGCALAVSDIQALNADAHSMLRVPQSWLPIHENDEDLKIARKKLRRYFERMGFQRICGTPYYALSTSQKAPTISEIIKPAVDG